VITNSDPAIAIAYSLGKTPKLAGDVGKGRNI